MDLVYKLLPGLKRPTGDSAMKLSVCFASSLLFAYASAFAQVPPSLTAQTPSPVYPTKQAPAASLNNKELTELLQAQTAAIRMLASKLDALESRIVAVEKK
jgi:hypothetical protein